MINIIGLTKTYHSEDDDCPDVKGLNYISLTLGDKGLVFVLGKSGSGKTTLLNLLGGLDTIDSGEILVNGMSIARLKGRDLDSYRNGCVGFVFQEFNLLENKTVKDNVAIALSLQRKKDKKAVEQVLRKVSILGLSDRKASTLSGGEKQRTAIARALVKDPCFLLCDEPTGALDSENGTRIMEILKDISATKLVVVVSHDEAFAKQFGDRIIKIEDGKIISDSKPCQRVGECHALPLVKSRMSLKQSLSMAIHSFKAKISRLAVTILLSAASFAACGIASAYSSWSADEATLSSILNNNHHKYVAVTSYDENGPAFISKRQIDALKKKFGTKLFIKETAGVDIYGNEVEYLNDLIEAHSNAHIQADISRDSGFSIGDVYGYMHFENEDLFYARFSVKGRLPEKENEIAIPNYYMNYLEDRYRISNCVGTKLELDIGGLSSREYEIVGVIDNDFNSPHFGMNDAYPVDPNSKQILDCVYDEVKNSFSGNIYVNDTLYDYLTSKDAKPITISNGIASSEALYETISESLEGLYTEFCYEQEDHYYSENAEYFDFDPETREVRRKWRWFDANGYTMNTSNGLYEKTIQGPDGEYTVIYSTGRGRISEEEDPYLIIPEKAPDNISRKEFVDEYFLFSAQSDKNIMFLDENTFAPLGENESVLIVDDEHSPLCADYLAGKNKVAIATNGEEVTATIRAVCLKRNTSNRIYTNSSIIVSTPLKEKLANVATGSYRLIVRLPENKSIIRDFYSYCADKNNLGLSLRVSDITESAIDSLSYIHAGPTLPTVIVAAVVLAFVSSLILMNFIGLSISYGKKEIGILRALGASNSDILSIYFIESLLITMINGSLGYLGSLIGASLINQQVTTYIFVEINLFHFSFVEPLIIFGLSFLFSLIAVSLPIWKNRDKKPIETLTDR